MVAQKGRDMLLKVFDTGSTYTTLAGLRKTDIKFGSEMVDITDIESSGQARELLEAGGVTSVTLSGSGIFKDDAMFEKARVNFVGQLIKNYQLLIPSYGTFQGAFQITDMTVEGEYNNAIQYSLTLESSGVIAFTAA